MNSKTKKDDFLRKADDFFNSHPIISGFILSFLAAVFLASIIINRSMIVSNMRFFAFILFVIPGAVIFIFVGIYLGMIINHKKAKEAMKGEDNLGLKLGSVAFYHMYMKDKTLEEDFPAVKGPCCAVCGEDFWEADRLEKGDKLIFECRKCRNTNSVRLRNIETVKEETDRTLQRAYERLVKFKNNISGQ
ncbi:MAG: hypothetical protein JXN63_01720 [Candidatus Delongbacteria bacterium]|nr:hypothetical protein [Candidatus Delongbacteria bacterium]